MPAETSCSHSSSQELAADIGLPVSITQPSLVGYRSVGIGVFGAVMRWTGMPLEKIALYMNSTKVSGKNQLQQAVKLTFREGVLSPYKVVGPASLTAWFMQYSVMGVAFQFFDTALSSALNVRPMYYGKELMEPPPCADEVDVSSAYRLRDTAKCLLSPLLASCLESFVSNRAEVQRFFGPKQFAALEQQLAYNPLRKAAGPAFGANAARNVIMCQTSFLLTPVMYKLYFPQEHKNKSSLFWFGLGLNVFVGNVVAITQQALWGRSLDYLQEHSKLQYRAVIQQGLKSDGIAAFFTFPKWFSRVLMNAPAQGTLPWFYNEVLPLGEPFFLRGFKTIVYDAFLSRGQTAEDLHFSLKEEDSQSSKTKTGRACNIQRTRTHFGTLPTANPEFNEPRSKDEE